MKKILMISYYYPPLADVGSLRALAFSKYLPEFGWEPYVLSVKNPDTHYCSLGDDKPPPHAKVHYTYSLTNLTWITGKLNGLFYRLLNKSNPEYSKSVITDLLCIPDQFIPWIPTAALKGYSLIKKHNIDLIYVSCTPFSASITAAALKQFTKKPLVLDFRDPFSPLIFSSSDKYYKRIPTFKLNKKIEEKVLDYADKLILVTEATKSLYLSFFPYLDSKIHVIYNGFMSDYFLTIPEPFDEFTIVYSGNFYYKQMDPKPFFRALKLLDDRGMLGRDKIKVIFVGRKDPWLYKILSKYGLKDKVQVTGYVSRSDSVDYISRASILLLRVLPPMITTKLYEGLAAGVPLLALTRRGEVSAIIEKYCQTPYYIVEPSHVEGIVTAIEDSYIRWQTGQFTRVKNPLFHSDFSKRGLTKRFAKILDGLIS